MLHRADLGRNRSDFTEAKAARAARTRRLIDLGGLIEKSGLAFILADNRSAILGALLEQVERAHRTNADAIRGRWEDAGLRAFNLDRETRKDTKE